MRSVMRHWLPGLLSLVLMLALATTAVAGDRGEQRTFNAADQAAARVATLKRADLIAPASWKGGPVKPDLSPPPSCPNYPIDLSSFVMTGAAETNWQRGLTDVDTEAQVFRTADTVAQEWKITLGSPKAVACLRAAATKAFASSGAKLVSLEQLPFPRLATFTRAYAVRADATSQGLTVPLLLEVVDAGKGRTEVELTISGVASQKASIAGDALRYARILVGRIHT
jgi:hypothetical protein